MVQQMSCSEGTLTLRGDPSPLTQACSSYYLSPRRESGLKCSDNSDDLQLNIHVKLN